MDLTTTDVVIAILAVGAALIFAVIVAVPMIIRAIRQSAKEQIDQRYRLENQRRENEEKRLHPETLERQARRLVQFVGQFVNNPKLAVSARFVGALVVLDARQQMLQAIAESYETVSTRLRDAQNELSRVPGHSGKARDVAALLEQEAQLSEQLAAFNQLYDAALEAFNDLLSKVRPPM